MGVFDFMLSVILGAILLPAGIVYGFFKCFYKHHLGSALQSANKKLIVLATAFDKYGNVVCSELFNDTLITKESAYRFGNIQQTVSMVVGYNLLNNTLTKTGKAINKFLDILFGKGHAINSIKTINNNMKKLAAIIILLFSIHANAQTKPPVKAKAEVKADTTQSKTLTLTGNVEAFQFLLTTLDNPDKALHKDVKALEEWITAQLQAQLKEPAKK